MCGRYVLVTPSKTLVSVFSYVPEMALPARYNIAPTQQVLIIRQEGGGRRGALVNWGLVPHWAKDPAMGVKMINARAEGVAEKPAFRDAFRHRRCLVPADGFYEWQKAGGGRGKVPHFIHRADGQPLAFAGLWEHWQNPNGTEIESCTIITTAANELVRPLHDRMPVILEPKSWDRWLAPGTATEELMGLLTPAGAGVLAEHAVGMAVNNVAHDGPGNVASAASAAPSPVEKPAQGELF